VIHENLKQEEWNTDNHPEAKITVFLARADKLYHKVGQFYSVLVSPSLEFGHFSA
jgi:hypothetical protein